MTHRITRRSLNAGIAAALASPVLTSTAGFAQGAAPIKIGFSMAQTGGIAAAGQQALLGAQQRFVGTAVGAAMGGPMRRKTWRHLGSAYLCSD